MLNPIFKENVQARKHPGTCAFAEPELLSYRKPKRVFQNEKSGHKYPNNSHNYHDENHDEIELYQGNIKGAHNDTQYQSSTHHKSHIDGDGAQLSNAQCHMVPISTLIEHLYFDISDKSNKIQQQWSIAIKHNKLMSTKSRCKIISCKI